MTSSTERRMSMRVGQPFDDNTFNSRADCQQAVRDIFEPLAPGFATAGARLRLGSAAAAFDPAAESLESFVRPLWGAAPLAAGGGNFDHWELFRSGLIRGTDPHDPQYWGRLGTAPGLSPKGDQRKVEMAALGFAMALAPDEIFSPLSPKHRQNVIDWLADINSAELMDNNWQFFRVMVDLGLAQVGGPRDKSAVSRALEKIDSFYLQDGWYQDGPTLRTTDFYGPFALHFYGLLYAQLAQDEDPSRAEEFRERARLFARHWEARFDSEGRVIAYGRSMTYRFAGAAFWGALAFAGVEALPWARIRHLWAQHLRWWARQSIFTDQGRLSIGWAYDNPHMRETYNSAGSPYWALKAFLPLALPPDHPFWTSGEDDGGADRDAESQQLQVPAGVVVNRSARQSVMLNSGRPGLWFPRQGAAKYGKLAYSSAFPFTLEPDDLSFFHTAESALALIDEQHERRTRSAVVEAGLDGAVAWSIWQPFDDVTVFSAVAGSGPVHSRTHIVDTSRTLTAVEGGFAIDDRFDPATDEQWERADGAWAQVSHPGACSIIVDRPESGGSSRSASVARLQPTASLQWPRSIAPMLTVELGTGRHVLHADVAATEAADHFDHDHLPKPDPNLARVVEARLSQN